MKPRAIIAYLDPMQDVARDFISLIREKRDSKNEMEGFLDNLYKWALECKFIFPVIFSTLPVPKIYSYFNVFTCMSVYV